MSNLLIKSNANLKAAKLLNDKKDYFGSVIHCCYYSVIQVIIHILINEKNQPYDGIKYQAEKLNRNVHSYTILLLIKEFKEINKSDASEFSDSLGILKVQRENADYKDELIQPNEASLAIARANDLIEQLKKNFKYDKYN